MVDKTISLIESKHNNIKILEKIGEGYVGVSAVYKCKIGDEFAICKIERKDDHDKNLASGFNRIVDFDKEFVRKNSTGFMNLEDYGIIKNCDYKFDVESDMEDWKRNERM